MTTSDVITELAAALAKAQAETKGASKDGTNPHFNSSYSTLASVWDACRGPLTKHGLSVLQSPRLTALGDLWVADIETRLLHSSGQWIADTISVPVTKLDAQGLGSAITYARRYALAAFAGVAPDDDDGNAAVGTRTALKAPATPEGYADWLADLAAVADEGTPALKSAWQRSASEYRDHLTATSASKLDQLKAIAAAATKAAK